MLILTALVCGSLVTPVTLARPELSHSQGMVESKMNFFAVGKHRDKGAYQVRECYWGKVPSTLRGQMLQNERIMDELLQASKGDLHSAVRKYNGRGKAARRYASIVIRGAIRVAIIGRT